TTSIYNGMAEYNYRVMYPGYYEVQAKLIDSKKYNDVESGIVRLNITESDLGINLPKPPVEQKPIITPPKQEVIEQPKPPVVVKPQKPPVVVNPTIVIPPVKEEITTDDNDTPTIITDKSNEVNDLLSHTIIKDDDKSSENNDKTSSIKTPSVEAVQVPRLLVLDISDTLDIDELINQLNNAKESIIGGYNARLLLGDEEISPNEKVIIEIAIDKNKVRNCDVKILSKKGLNGIADAKITDETDDKYILSFETDQLGDFILVATPKTNIWFILFMVILLLAIILATAFIIIKIFKNRKEEK
ncbi:MAG: hypothetical protein RSE93_06490, partial [Oscillospiraceae bacterium]